MGAKMFFRHIASCFFSLLLLAALGGCCTTSPKTSQNMFSSQGSLVDANLKRLLSITHQTHDGTLASIVSATQNKENGWLRSGERWHKQKETYTEDQLIEIVSLARKLGFVDSKAPKLSSRYDRVLLLGAASTRVHSRLTYLVKLWKQGVRFNKIVMLGSERSLDAPASDAAMKKEISDAGYELNEKGLIEYTFHHKVAVPEEMKALPILWIKAKGKNGKRANTDDTIETWLNEDTDFSQGMKILSISNQPHASYQGAVIQAFLNKDPRGRKVQNETVGEGDSLATHEKPSHQDVSILLDAMARYFYSLKKNFG